MPKHSVHISHLIYAYFFAFLLFRGVPDLGCILLALLGMFISLQTGVRHQVLIKIGGWSKQDTWLSLSIASVFVFKLLSMLWSNNPELALKNAIWHIYLITWPLVFLAICYAKPNLIKVLKALSYGMIIITIWNVVAILFQLPFYHLRPGFDLNAGILAELLLVSGTWLLVAATDKSEGLRQHEKWLFAISSGCAWFTLYTTGRRTEWIAFFIVALVIILWRLRRHLTPTRTLILFGAGVCMLVTFFYLRQERFLLAYQEAISYLQQPNKEVFNQSMATSVGARLEMYRLGISAFLDNPILGIGAGARPYLLPEYGGGGLGGVLFHHRHFHSEYLQALVEGGVIWAVIFATAIAYFIKKMVIEKHANENLISMLSFALVACFMMAGTVSASLIYNQPVATFVVFSALLWATSRTNN
ncbi:O-antigen ligase family protein [Formosimonas limnophila]|nr:O-antigen ligase family protein [Formosimonas limnophila]